ncbi:MAG: M4 family metallopeptidase [Myxococcota bacterium]
MGWVGRTAVVCSLLGCVAEPAPTENIDLDRRLAEDSEAPAYIERTAEGGFQGAFVRIPIPSTVPADPEAEAGWFLSEYGRGLGLSDVDDVSVREVIRGAPGDPDEHHAVVQYDRTERGIEVYGAGVIVEVDGAGHVTAVIAQVPDDLDELSTVPEVSEGTAQLAVIDRYPGGRITATDLVFLNEGLVLGFVAPTRLAWRVSVSDEANQPVRFVDAISGDVLAFASSNVLTARNRHVHTTTNCEGNNSDSVLSFTEAGAVDGAETSFDAQSAYDHLGAIYDYFQTTHRRDSFDDRGGTIDAVANIRNTLNLTTMGPTCVTTASAAWIHGVDRMLLGEGMATRDIIAHEFTHGVVAHSARLETVGPPGALNESFADVFAAFADDTMKWIVGEGSSLGVLRSLRQPREGRGNPPSTLEDYRQDRPTARQCLSDADCGTTCPNRDTCADSGSCTSYQCIGAVGGAPIVGVPTSTELGRCEPMPGECNDHGYVHVNANITNHAAYLAIHGGLGPNRDTVRGVGQAKGEQIWYRALTRYLTPSADFPRARIALWRAAKHFADRNMHGMTHRDCAQVLRAFHSVGIGEGDFDEDCVPDDVDNCSTQYNPDQAPVADCNRCGDHNTCGMCAATDGCTWCADESQTGCVPAEGPGESCSMTISDEGSCTAVCGLEAAPCSGSGSAFDGECCGALICVVGSCVQAGLREQAACSEDTADCARGLACRPQTSAGPTACCARGGDYCQTKADCCGFQECTNNTCIARNEGESCLLGDCDGIGFCEAGVCME